MALAHPMKKPACPPGHQPVRDDRRRARRILSGLRQEFPEARVELHASTPLELLIGTILSAQSTDRQVNLVTPALFSRYSTVGAYASADVEELERLIRPTGFYRNKARTIVACCRELLERFDGVIPQTMDALLTLPGVGRKTANVILGSWFGQPAIVVDTHVQRVSKRLGLTNAETPEQIEYALQALLPRAQWTEGAQRLLLHGRYVCLARRPRCDRCAVFLACSWEGKRGAS